MREEVRLKAMKSFYRLLTGVIIIVLIGMIGLVSWATVNAQTATTRAVAVLQANGVQ